MCSASQVADPLGLTYKYKWADPLGVTKTAVGDPAGIMRQGHAEEAAYRKSWSDYNKAMGGSSTTLLGGTGEGEIRRDRKQNTTGYTMLGN